MTQRRPHFVTTARSDASRGSHQIVVSTANALVVQLTLCRHRTIDRLLRPYEMGLLGCDRSRLVEWAIDRRFRSGSKRPRFPIDRVPLSSSRERQPRGTARRRGRRPPQSRFRAPSRWPHKTSRCRNCRRALDVCGVNFGAERVVDQCDHLVERVGFLGADVVNASEFLAAGSSQARAISYDVGEIPR